MYYIYGFDFPENEDQGYHIETNANHFEWYICYGVTNSLEAAQQAVDVLKGEWSK